MRHPANSQAGADRLADVRTQEPVQFGGDTGHDQKSPAVLIAGFLVDRRFGDEFPSRVQTDSAWGSVSTSDKPREVDRFHRRFDAMAASALPPEDTPDFLHRLEREL
ncbi:Scr1 family TA system antitoxin-like transcriptional regulator [Streptomyces gossypiisoli]|uniref:Scr1 family TA system antitoxin-like transcriptional regulator n=1 Tax=Streptomyces sp. N502 TaxID=2730916 RepID=UPI002F9672BA